MFTKPSTRGAIIRIVVLGLAWGWSVMHSGAVPKQPSRPIVAEMVADPDAYIGTHVIIYGLVLESDLASRSFMLQDVSQHPIKVDGRNLPPIAAGDQVQIEGVLQRNASALVLRAEAITPVRVLAGGGCC